MLGTGSDGYDVTDNWICGNIALSEGGGGIGHQGLSNNGLIAYNKIIFNEAWSNQADGQRRRHLHRRSAASRARES